MQESSIINNPGADAQTKLTLAYRFVMSGHGINISLRDFFQSLLLRIAELHILHVSDPDAIKNHRIFFYTSSRNNGFYPSLIFPVHLWYTLHKDHTPVFLINCTFYIRSFCVLFLDRRNLFALDIISLTSEPPVRSGQGVYSLQATYLIIGE